MTDQSLQASPIQRKLFSYGPSCLSSLAPFQIPASSYQCLFPSEDTRLKIAAVTEREQNRDREGGSKETPPIQSNAQGPSTFEACLA